MTVPELNAANKKAFFTKNDEDIKPPLNRLLNWFKNSDGAGPNHVAMDLLIASTPKWNS